MAISESNRWRLEHGFPTLPDGSGWATANGTIKSYSQFKEEAAWKANQTEKAKNKKPGKSKKLDNISPEVGRIMIEGDGIFQCYPKFDGEFSYDSVLKIRFIAKELLSQKSNARRGQNVGNKELARFTFLAPNELIETVSHQWEPYDSIASKIAELAATGLKWKSELKGLGGDGIMKQISNLGSKATEGNWSTLDGLAKKGSSMAGVANKANTSQSRVDMPLVYKNSERRRYEFTLPMSTWNGGPYDILYPVRALECLSCPTLADENDLADIIPPCVFEIETDPVGLLNVKTAALVNVQPTFKGPYMNGIPSTCDLHLAFVELDPLWDKQFSNNTFNKKVLATESKNDAQLAKKPGTQGSKILSNLIGGTNQQVVIPYRNVNVTGTGSEIVDNMSKSYNQPLGYLRGQK